MAQNKNKNKKNNQDKKPNQWEMQYEWMADELDMSTYELKAFCCHDCLNNNKQVSYDDFEKCHKMIHDMVMEAMEDKRSVVMTVRIAMRSRIYAKLREYLVEQEYDAFEDSHFMPLSFEFAIENAMGVEFASKVTIMSLLKKRY